MASIVESHNAFGVPFLRTFRLAFITWAGFFLLGYASSIILTQPGQTVSLIWAASAFGVVMIARLSRSTIDDLAMLAAVFLGDVAINLAGHTPGPLGWGFSVINTIEVLAGVMAIRWAAPKRIRGLGSLAAFGFAAVVAPCALSAVLAEGWIRLMGQPSWAADAFHWFSAHFLAFCIILPFGLNISWRQIAKLHLEERWMAALLTFVIMAGVSFVALRGFHHPIPSLVVLVVLGTTVRFRLLGAAVAMFSVLAIIFTKGHMTADEIQLDQIFLAVLSFITARTAMFLNERDLHQVFIERRRRRAMRASRFKNQLLSHVSAEARGPLSAIIGLSAMLESGEMPPGRAQEFAHIVVHNGELLQRLYGDLLDFTRAQADDLSIAPERVKVGPTLKSCISAIRQEVALGGKPVVMDKVEEDLEIEADPRRLVQILNNLIANSYKYGDNHSPIKVRALRLSDGFGRIEVCNSGPGIPLRERDTLFKPLGSDSGGRRVPGAMLGLSIAKLLTEKQGGRIDFESVPGRQTRFWIDLPLTV
jgi:signal transduction histidine kinase